MSWRERLYCWVFEHDDIFKHSQTGVTRQYWCQRCYKALK